MRGDLGRIHGSVGVAIDCPNLCLKAIKSDSLKVKGPRANRVREFAGIIMIGTVINCIFNILTAHLITIAGIQRSLNIGTKFSFFFRYQHTFFIGKYRINLYPEVFNAFPDFYMSEPLLNTCLSSTEDYKMQ